MSTPWKLYCRTLNSTSLAVWKKIDDISRRRETSYLNVKKRYLTLRAAQLLVASRVFAYVDVSVSHQKVLPRAIEARTGLVPAQRITALARLTFDPLGADG